MTNVTIDSARTYLLGVTLPPVDKSHASLLLDDTTPSFDASKDQAVVVGSGVVTFAQGVPPERRLAVTNSLLLAQLVARRAVPDGGDIDDWYKQYTSVLANIGWLVQTTTTTHTADTANEFETHEAILAVATLLLGPGAVSALSLISTTLNALATMDTSKPWITIFDRETQAVNASSFQVALAETAPDGSFVVSLMAFVIKANAVVTQVLFFKAKHEDVQFSHYASQAQIDTAILDSLEPDLSNRVAQHSKSYISQLPDL
ncbi:hypothetical protein LMG27952_03985 [Paraburkholderia hiiakae]|uniref:Uncharacterized protein n=1 Tax=Paraburkholderia hiiakae TaxID=1081782 RepID=A0ABN7I2F7_9BURK|nr:hypothetical protein [Paraburkholderia hiiakae]CAD6543081.1 hypothetical protein LMG27952_03985 [Paraburkholderia hiiakae]